MIQLVNVATGDSQVLRRVTRFGQNLTDILFMFNTYKVNAWPLMNSLLDPLLTATLLTALIFQSLK